MTFNESARWRIELCRKLQRCCVVPLKLEKCLIPHLTDGRGRERPCGRPPAQIRTCGITAYGSYLGSWRWHGHPGTPRTMARARRVDPALSPGRGLRHRAPLGRPPSLHRLRRRHVLAVVRRLLRYYAVVRLPPGVHAGGTALGLFRPTHRDSLGGCLRDLPF